MKTMKALTGFTLIELIVVLAIMAILALMAMPSVEPKYTRAQINESIDLTKNLKESVTVFYMANQKFPRNNLEAGIPKPEFLMGNYAQRIDLENGTFQITFGNRANGSLKNKILSIRPIVVADSPESPISWLCGNASVPAGMIAVGTNRTDIANHLMPINCF